VHPAANELASSATVAASAHAPGKAQPDSSGASSGQSERLAAVSSFAAVPAASATVRKLAASQATTASAPARTVSSAQTAPNPGLILAPTRRVAASGLLAPVSIANRPVPTAVVATNQTRSAGSARLAAASSLATGGGFASAQPQPAVRPAAAAPALAPTQRAPAITGNAPVAIDGPGSAPPVKISLAPPVMRPGPRTTVLTSNIRDVMRRPASAWDYAEALPPELTGHAGQQSASAQPQIMQTQAVQAATAQPGVAMRQAPSAQIAVHRPAPARIVPPSAASGVVSAEALATPSSSMPSRAVTTARARAAKTTPERQAAGALSSVQPSTESGRIASRSAAEGPVALLDLPANAARPAPVAVRTARHLAMAVHGRRGLPTHGRRSAAANVALNNPRHKLDRSDMAETSGLSLRDRIPRPAF